VLVVAGVLFLCEAVADKIPYADTACDVVHTVVRPVAGAVVAALPAGHQGSLPQLTAGAIGGSTALAGQLVEAGTRMAVNTSPEPAGRQHRAEPGGGSHGRRDCRVRAVPSAGGGGDRGDAAGAGIAMVVFSCLSRIRRFRWRRRERRAGRSGGPAGRGRIRPRRPRRCDARSRGDLTRNGRADGKGPWPA
jgi:hypothetical protein